MKANFLKHTGATVFIFLLSLSSFIQADTIANPDSVVVNEATKQVFSEAKKGLSKETSSNLIAGGIFAVILFLGIFFIRKQIANTKKAETKRAEERRNKAKKQ